MSAIAKIPLAVPKRVLAGSPKRRASIVVKVTPQQHKEFLERAAFYEIPSDLLSQIFFDAILEMIEGNPPLGLPLRLEERLS